jgi:hypothetical protein
MLLSPDDALFSAEISFDDTGEPTAVIHYGMRRNPFGSPRGFVAIMWDEIKMIYATIWSGEIRPVS